MSDLFVLVFAVGTAATVVWRLSVGPSTSLRARPRQPRVRFEETLEVTALPIGEAAAGPVGPSFAFEESAADPPRRTWAAVRLVLLMAILASAGAASIWALAHFINRALASRLGGG